MRHISLRNVLVKVYDIAVILIAFYCSVAFLYGEIHPAPFGSLVNAAQLLGLIVVVQFTVFSLMGLYKAILRFSSIPDLIRVTSGVCIAVPMSYLAIYFYGHFENIRRATFVVDWFLLIFGLNFGRLVYRIMKDSAIQKIKQLTRQTHKRTFIIGAGVAGERLLREISLNANLPLEVLGFVDDSTKKIGKSIHGVNIFGPIQRLPELISDHDVEHLIIAMPSASTEQVRQITNICRDLNKDIELKILPKMTDVLDGKLAVNALRNIEPEDLLGRKVHNLDMHKMSAMLKDKVVMITGAGGSIGSEMCKQVAKFQPKLIVLFELTELFLYELEMMLKEQFPDVRIQAVIGDVRNVKRLAHVFDMYRPEVVFHAAAYKHVPIMEENPIEAIRTNVLGTYNVATLATKFRVDRFVLVSTDKAINPTNIMGASKRIAELICMSMNEATTKFTIVRFGNVLGSSGSVIPLFKKQIERGGPVTVTHPEMRRYFMSISEATQLVIQAGALGGASEVMVLNMGEPTRITDLAMEMISLAGYKPNVDMHIEYTGLRPGEKLFEELFHSGETILPTTHPMVKIAKVPQPQKDFKMNLDFLMTLPEHSTVDSIKEAIKCLVPEYKNGEPTENIPEKVH